MAAAPYPGARCWPGSFLSVKDEGKVIARIMALAERLSPRAGRFLIGLFRDRFGKPDDTAAERKQKSRQKQRDMSRHPEYDSHAVESVTVTPNGSPTPLPVSAPNNLPGFSEFWQLYPRKTGKDRARKAWERKGCEAIRSVVVQALRDQLPALEREGHRDNGNFCPHPTTWLNDGRWKDEVSEQNTGVLLSDLERRNLEAGRRFVARGQQETAQ